MDHRCPNVLSPLSLRSIAEINACLGTLALRELKKRLSPG